MLDFKQTTLVYRCPVCGTHVTSVVGVFALSGDYIVLKCPCGESELEIEKLDDDRIKLHVPCSLCSDGHNYTVQKSSLFDIDLLTIPCKFSPITMCAIGKKEEALAIMKQADEELLQTFRDMGMDVDDESIGKLSRANTMGDGGFFESGSTLYDIANFMLSEFSAEGKIECRCGGSEDSYAFELLGDEEDSIRFFCRDCGSAAVYPARELFYTDGSFRLEKIYLF